MSAPKNFFAVLTVIFIAFFSTCHIAFANEESDAHNIKGVQIFNNAKNSQDYQNALNEYTAAINTDPNDNNISSYYSNRGSTQYKLGNYAAALEDLNKALELNGKNAFGYYWRALVYEAQKNFDAAKEDWNSTGNVDYSDGKYETAAQRYTSAINIDDKNPEYYKNRGWAYYQLQKYDDAKKDFDKAISLNQNYANAYRGRACVYEVQEKKEEAVLDYLKAGNIYYNNDNFDQSKEDFENALRLDDKNKEAQFYLALITQNNLNDPKAAIDMYENMIKSGNDYFPHTVYFNLGAAYSKSNNYGKSITAYEKAIELDPGYMLAYQRLANIYFYNTKDYFNAWIKYYEILKLDDSKKSLSEENRSEYEKNKNVAYNSLNPLEKLIITILYGELDRLLKAFIIIMALDFVLFIAEKKKSGNLTAITALKELSQKAILLVIVLVVDEIDDAGLITLDLSNIFIAVILLWEILLLLDNAGKLGIPIPEDLKNFIEKIIEKIKKIFGLQ